MYIQPCTTKYGGKVATLNFSSKKSNGNDYFSYISDKSFDIITISSLGGGCLSLISAKDNLKKEFIPKACHNIGVATLALFGITSLNYFISAEKNSKQKK